jgi:ABC-2 type transport system ATP-binding protein
VQVRLAGEADRFIAAARTLSFVKEASASDGSLSVQLDDPDGQSPVLVEALITAGAQIRSVEPINHTMEDVYRQLIGAQNEEVRQ